MFAEDTMLYMRGTDISDMVNLINKKLDTMYRWLCDNSLRVNIEKTKYILCGSKHQ